MVAGCDRGTLRSAACGRNGVNASRWILAGCRKERLGERDVLRGAGGVGIVNWELKTEHWKLAVGGAA